jgi:hypothetical protein
MFGQRPGATPDRSPLHVEGEWIGDSAAENPMAIGGFPAGQGIWTVPILFIRLVPDDLTRLNRSRDLRHRIRGIATDWLKSPTFPADTEEEVSRASTF